MWEGCSADFPHDSMIGTESRIVMFFDFVRSWENRHSEVACSACWRAPPESLNKFGRGDVARDVQSSRMQSHVLLGD